ncbi:YebC/PmpR family DNA-binding transcriptional regulator [Planctomycetota bacterium]
MAGHSHSANIRFRKDRQDAKRGKVFAKLSKAITLAARQRGGDIGANSTLRLAVDKARAENMPKDNIERAIRIGTGEGVDAQNLYALIYEGYAAGGVAVMVEVLTDNRNRTASELRNIFEKSGQLGSAGCVSYLFEKKGLILIQDKGVNEEELMELVLETGADDISSTDGMFEILTSPQIYYAVLQAIEDKDIPVEHAEVASIATNMIEVSENDQRKVLKLLEMLDDNDDVANIYHNCELSAEVMR